jgi:hypothetical protein
MSDKKERIRRSPRSTPSPSPHTRAIDLFTSIGVGVFRYSAALVPWTESELERLEAMWVQAQVGVGLTMDHCLILEQGGRLGSGIPETRRRSEAGQHELRPGLRGLVGMILGMANP